jgi:hypothetical protein
MVRMRTPPLALSCNRSTARAGFALEATLLMMVLLAAVVGAAVGASVMLQRSARTDALGTRVQYAAEAGADAVMAQLQTALQDGIISDAELAAISAPTLTGFTYARVDATRVGAPVARTITNGAYRGLFGLNQRIDLDIETRDAQSNRANVVVSVNTQAIPLFQFGVFYQEDLEIHNGPPLTFAGWVHTNSNLYLASSNQYFEDLVTTPNRVFHRYKDGRGAGPTPGTYIDNAAGTAQTLNFDSSSLPSPQDFVLRSQQLFDGRLQTGAHGVTALNLPLPTGVPPIEMIRPRNAGDAAEVRDVKFAWKADMHIAFDVSNPSAFCTSLADAAVMDRPGLQKPTAAQCAAIFTWRPDAFHEGRELIGADVLDVDISALMTWFAAAPTTRLASQQSTVYVTFTGLDAATSARDYPAVRLINGATLAYPFTFASNRPLYVHGSFNSIGWQPSSLLGDAVTFLSTAFVDDVAGHRWNGAAPLFCSTAAAVGSCPFTRNTAVPTSVYAAVAAGHSATPCDAGGGAGCTSPLYGGGLENFPRFLENWTGVTFTYRGSLVSLFQSAQAARRPWAWRTYYNPPNRDWAFELRFRDPRNLPPGTPTVGTVNRIAFRPVY